MTILFFVVYAGFIGWVSFWIPWATSMMSSARIAQRNPEWLCSQPELAERLRRRRLPVMFSRVVGIVLLGALSLAAFTGQPLETMTVVLISSLVAATISFFLDLWSYWRLNRLVPAPAKREADLRSTRHEEHMPTQWVRSWHATLFAAIGLYGFAYLQELVPLGLAVARTIGIGLIIVISWFSHRVGRRLPPQPGQRKVGIGVMVFCSLVVLGRIAQDFFDAPRFNEIWFWFFVAVTLQVLFVLAAIRGIRESKARPPKAAPSP
jgi:hypothetical protein